MEKVPASKYTICHNARRYCREDIALIQNYSLMINDYTQVWCCHHRLEISENKSASQLKKEGRYYNVAAAELIFLTASEHTALHNANMSEERRRAISKANKITKTGVPLSAEHRQHITDAMNRPDVKKRHKDVQNRPDVKKKKSKALNRPDVKQKLSEATKGTKWWSNGIETLRAKECPGEGFTLGRGSLKRVPQATSTTSDATT